VHRDTASPMMPVALLIACWLEAKVRLEGCGAVGVVQQFCRGDRERAADFLQRRRGGGGVFIGGFGSG
jgi:hypothetical protein